ncbi:MAG: inositol monophosphatase family protein [Casimicrobium sp.]
MHPMLNTAIKAARKAADVIQYGARNLDRLTIDNKGPGDYVSEVDKGAEAAIVDILLEAYPTHGIMAEEGSGATRGNSGSDFIWVIDPLDGTTNFLHGVPQYCVSIALKEKNIITQAVIYDPSRNDLFTATRGSGAYLNNRRIRVSKQLKLRDCLIGTGFPFRDGAAFDEYLVQLKNIMPKCAGLRRPGAAALDLAYVAAGYFDGFWEMKLNQWDMAAGALLIQEAGGLVTGIDGEDTYMESGSIVAGTPKIFPELLKTLQAKS